MSASELEIGDAVAESPMGPGNITGFSERGFPMVDHVTVAWLRREDGALFDPYGVSQQQADTAIDKARADGGVG